MTPLRQQLESSHREYHALHYHGNLADEMLSPPLQFRGGYVLGAILTSAIAASTMLAVMLPRPMLMPASTRARMSIVQEFQVPQKMPFGLPSVPGLPRMAPHMSLREMAPSMVPAEGWHLPSLEDLRMPT